MDSVYENGIGTSTITILLLGLFLVPTIFYFITLQKALTAVSNTNRQMPAAQVWLCLIPIFNFVWIFVVVNRIAESFRLECGRLNIPSSEKKPTQNIGIAMIILYFCTLIPGIQIFASIGFIVCWIIHWINVNRFKNLIIANKDNDSLDAEKGIFHQ